MKFHPGCVFRLKLSTVGPDVIEWIPSRSNRLCNQALERRKTAGERGKESLGCGRGSTARGGMGRSGVCGIGHAIHVAAVQLVPFPEPSGQVGDLPLQIPRAGRGQGCERRGRDLGCRGSRRRSASVGRWAVRRSRTAHERGLTRHCCIQARAMRFSVQRIVAPARPSLRGRSESVCCEIR